MAKKYLERNVNQVITWSRNQVSFLIMLQMPFDASCNGRGTPNDHR